MFNIVHTSHTIMYETENLCVFSAITANEEEKNKNYATIDMAYSSLYFVLVA